MFTNKPARLAGIPAGVAVLAVAAAPAFAHAPVKTRTPGPGTTASQVRSVSISFKEAVITGKISVTGAGNTVAATSSGLNGKKTVLRAAFAHALSAGTYKVS